MEQYNKNKKSKMVRKNRLDDGYMGMISEDYSAPANLPQEVVHKSYPKNDYLDMFYLDDTYKGIDDNIKDSQKKIEKNPSKSMY